MWGENMITSFQSVRRMENAGFKCSSDKDPQPVKNQLCSDLMDNRSVILKVQLVLGNVSM
eukprot:4369342-Amphidinium_carterae.1